MGDVRVALAGALSSRRAEMPELIRVDQYYRGIQDRPYIPKRAEAEFGGMVTKSLENWLPLIVSTVAQNLRVEGYRRSDKPEDLEPWGYWADNLMDSRQAQVHRAALTFGKAYVSVMPGTSPITGQPAPVIRPMSPLSVTGFSEDPDADWLDLVVRSLGKVVQGEDTFLRWEVWDDEAVSEVWQPEGTDDPAEWRVVASEAHGMDRCPVVVFRNRWADSPTTMTHELGEVSPLMPIQDRINSTTFDMLVAQSYSAFRQRWATGIQIPKDPKTGRPVETFQAAVDRVWATPGDKVRFGEFEQTDLSGYLSSREAAIKAMAAIAQVPPHSFASGVANISADALTALETGLSRKVHERQTIFGEAWGQVFRLAAYAVGDASNAQDTEARVIWHDAEARSLSQTVDALGKAHQMLGVPQQALWERIPGVTTFDVEAWRALKVQEDEAAERRGLSLIMGADHTGRDTEQDAGPVASDYVAAA
ncbi:phage portal protein [Streptomyces bacillaris]|uniref:phage portal protein n=1 Tax=Streptomyces bacillaris TaxID=68179 RepID=UPI0037FF6BB2